MKLFNYQHNKKPSTRYTIVDFIDFWKEIYIMKKNVLLNSAMILSLLLTACTDKEEKKTTESTNPTAIESVTPSAMANATIDDKKSPVPSAVSSTPKESDKKDFVFDVKKQYQVEMQTTLGTIKLKLYSKESPKAVENFVRLVNNQYYNGIIFHRIIKGFMIQTGDPTGTGTGGQSAFGKEFENEDDPSLSYNKAGILGMANHGKNTNGSQFFITTGPRPHLDHGYTIFGEVTEGLEVVSAIEKVKTNEKDKPLEDVKMTQVTLIN